MCVRACVMHECDYNSMFIVCVYVCVCVRVWGEGSVFLEIMKVSTSKWLKLTRLCVACFLWFFIPIYLVAT